MIDRAEWLLDGSTNGHIPTRSNWLKAVARRPVAFIVCYVVMW